MHFLVTGHTGFKGAWLVHLLHSRGHTVSGISLEPEAGSLFEKNQTSRLLKHDIRCDIRNYDLIKKHFLSINPDVVIHLAAQALVKESYKNPLDTFQTNVNGTLNILRASQDLKNLKAQLIITTDKVYQNMEDSKAYKETDSLGGRDPYSASKSMADIATQSWLASFQNPPTAIGRAGNVIGGGDICADRLIPDLVKSYISGETPKLRAPNSIRPWQHVLDCLNGYLILVEALISGHAQEAWNFGPGISEYRSVSDVSTLAGETWGVTKKWELDLIQHPYESKILMLDSNKARNQLGWTERFTFEESVSWTINWYKNVRNGIEPLKETSRAISYFEGK